MPLTDPFESGQEIPFPEPETSLWQKATNAILTPLSTAGEILGSAGSEVRGVLAGKGLTNPFTNWTSGRDLLDAWGVFPKGEGFDFAGLAADFIDPFLLVGSFTGLTSAGKAAQGLSNSQKMLKALQETAVVAKSSPFLPEIERGIASLTKNISTQLTKGVTTLAEDIPAQFATGQRGMQAGILGKAFGPVANTEGLFNVTSKIKEFLPDVPPAWKKYFSTAKLTDIGEQQKKIGEWMSAKGIEEAGERARIISQLTDTAMARIPELKEPADVWKLMNEAHELPSPEKFRTMQDAKIASLNEQIELQHAFLEDRIATLRSGYAETDIFSKTTLNAKDRSRVLKWQESTEKEVASLTKELESQINLKNNTLKRIEELSGMGDGIIMELGKFYENKMETTLRSDQALFLAVTKSSDWHNYLHRVLSPEGYNFVKSNEAVKNWAAETISTMTGAFKERSFKDLTLAEANAKAKELYGIDEFFITNPIVLNEHRLFVSQAAQHSAMSISNAALHHYDSFPAFDDWAVTKGVTPNTRELMKGKWAEERDLWSKQNNMRPLAEMLANGKLTGTVVDVPVAPSWVPSEYKTPWVKGTISDENLIRTLAARKDPVMLLKGEDVLKAELNAGRQGEINWGLLSNNPDKALKTVQKALMEAGVGNRYISNDIYSDLVKITQGFTNNQKPFWQYWDTINQFQRTYVTSINPSYLATNVLGNTWVNFIAGVKPSAYISGFKALVNKYIETNPEGWLSKLVSPFELTPQETEWAAHFFDTGAGGKNFLRAALEQEEGVVTQSKLTDNMVTRAGYKINSFNEDWAKLSHYMSKRADGLDMFAAGDSVKKYLFDYSDLTHFEKDIMRRFVLFYTFTRKMMPLAMTETFLNQRAYFAATASRESMNSEQFVPDYVKNTGQIYIGGNQYLDLRNPLFDTNRFSPEGQDLARTGQKLLAGTPAQVRIPLEFIAGKQFFSGKPLEQTTPLPGLGGSYTDKTGKTRERVMYPALNELLSGTPAPQLARQVEGRFGGPGVRELPPVEARRLNAAQAAIQAKLMDFPEVQRTPIFYSGAAQPDPRVKALLEQLRHANKTASGI